MLVASPGLCPGRVRSPTLCFRLCKFSNKICDANQHSQKQDTSSRRLVGNVCSNKCFWSEMCGREGCSREGLGNRNTLQFSLGRPLFSICFFDPFLFTPTKDCERKKWSKWSPKVPFSETVFRNKKRNMRSDCTGANGLHVSPTVERARYLKLTSKNQTDSRSFVVQRRIRLWTECDTKKVSQCVTVFRTIVPWGHLGAPLVPQSVF